MKFKIGDKVRVRQWADMKEEFGLDGNGAINCRCHFVKAMREYCGKVLTISHECNGAYWCNKSSWTFSDDMLEPACDSKIVITTDGETTLARLYEDGEVKKSAKAECSPDDTFDFSFGAKLAFERLIKPTPKFRVDDKVIGNAKAERYCITMKDRRGTVEKVNPDGSIDVRDNRWPAIKFKKLDPDCFDLYTEPEYYNGKVVCVEKKKEHYSYTVGKIYEFKNGRVKLDNGRESPCTTRVTSLDEWNDSDWAGAKFIEIKE